MKSLEEKMWGKFRIGDLFTVSRPYSRNKDMYSSGSVPFVASGAENNGVVKFCDPQTDEKLDDKNCITVSPVDGTSFYQTFDFLGRGGAGSSILMLRSDACDALSGLFISRMIKNTCSKYTYGHMGNTESIKREMIMLPVNNEGEPDYEYMAEYVQRERERLLCEYKDYIERNSLDEGSIINIPSLEEKNWQPFLLTDIFPEIERGKRLKSADHISGQMPYVSSSAEDNGVDDFVSNDAGVRIFSDCISFANSGSVGSAFYEPFAFVASDHITHLKNSAFSKEVYLFIATMMQKIASKYDFNREINDYRILREKVLLPVNDNDEPDYEYMEQYIKNMMIKKYQQYEQYITKQVISN